jgi:putative flippase GtrA
MLQDDQPVLKNSSSFIGQFAKPEFYRFLVIGGTNTVFSYAIYALFLIFLPYQVAYTIAYALGIILSYYLNSRFTFRAKMRLVKAAQYPIVYVVQYGLSLLLIYVLVEFWHTNTLVATAIAIPAIIPISYIMTKFIIQDRSS